MNERLSILNVYFSNKPTVAKLSPDPMKSRTQVVQFVPNSLNYVRSINSRPWPLPAARYLLEANCTVQ